MSEHRYAAEAARRAHELELEIARLQAEYATVDGHARAWHRQAGQKLANGDHVDADGNVARASRRETGASVQQVMVGVDPVMLHSGSGSMRVLVLSGSVRPEGASVLDVGEEREFRGSVRLYSQASSSVSVTYVGEQIVPASREGAEFPLLTQHGWVHD